MQRKFVLVSLFVLIGLQAFCQLPFFQQYHLLKKNEQVHVNDILQDSDGIMWIGTVQGLFKFDGKNKQHFTLHDSLSNINVTALAQDSSGRIWLGHGNGSISFIEHDKIKPFNPQEGTSSEAITDILFDSQGIMWFGTANDGLYYFKNKRLFRLDEMDGMPDLYVNDITEDDRGNAWVATDRGIVKCSFKNDKLSLTSIGYSQGLPDNIITRIVADPRLGLLMATESAGVFSYDINKGKAMLLLPQPWTYGAIKDFVVRGKKLWISIPQGLMILDTSSKALKIYNTRKLQGITSIKVLEKDYEGNIWAGSRAGLVRTPGDELEYIDEFITATDPNVLAITVDQSQNIWFSNNEGLFKRSIESSGETKLEKILNDSRYKKYKIISLYTDKDGYIWAGLYGEGAMRINPSTGKILHFQKELRNGNILNITGKDNAVWLSTLGGASKIIIKGEDVEVQNFNSGNGLISDFIYQIFIDTKNRVWFATDGRGVSMTDGRKFYHYEQGLPSKVIYGITEDSRGTIFVNVQGKGIYALDSANIFQPASDLNIRDNDVSCLVSDALGNLLIMHDAGIDMFDVARKKIHYIGEESGLKERFANLNAWSKNSAGDVLFATSDGIVKYGIKADSAYADPRPILSSIKVFDRTIDFNSKKPLSYDDNNVTFNFSGIWYQSPENVYFQYKLDQYDRDWISTRNLNVTYSRLPPGQYTFYLKASANENFAGAKEIAHTVVINPPFWKTPPFFMLCLGVLIVSGYAVVKYREKRLRYDNQVLEMKVERRTFEIQRQTEEIQAQNEEIMAQAEEINGINENLEQIVRERTADLERKTKALEEYAFINAHKLRSPVASILGLVNLLCKTKLDKEGQEINKRLSQSAEELDEIVRSITKALERGEKQMPY
jgi:ligand-binding sensor domain-containing protein